MASCYRCEVSRFSAAAITRARAAPTTDRFLGLWPEISEAPYRDAMQNLMTRASRRVGGENLDLPAQLYQVLGKMTDKRSRCVAIPAREVRSQEADPTFGFQAFGTCFVHLHTAATGQSRGSLVRSPPLVARAILFRTPIFPRAAQDFRPEAGQRHDPPRRSAPGLRPPEEAGPARSVAPGFRRNRGNGAHPPPVTR